MFISNLFELIISKICKQIQNREIIYIIWTVNSVVIIIIIIIINNCHYYCNY